jgi:hypothetical protein
MMVAQHRVVAMSATTIEAPTDRSAATLQRLARILISSEPWRAAGFAVEPLGDEALAARQPLTPPGIRVRADRASATRSPWIYANGWRLRRHAHGRYAKVPAGKTALAAAEAFAYGADVALPIDPADTGELGRMQAFLARLPASDLPEVADFGVVDDGSDDIEEVLNLLSRRNLLYQAVKAPSGRFPFTVQLGTPEYPREAASDPSDFALRIRRQLTDARRSLRVFGSEVVVARLTAGGTRARLHLLNYGGREIEGVRLRVRGSYPTVEAHVAGQGPLPVTDHMVVDGATEFTLPRLPVYGVVDLTAGR